MLEIFVCLKVSVGSWVDDAARETAVRFSVITSRFAANKSRAWKYFHLAVVGMVVCTPCRVCMQRWFPLSAGDARPLVRAYNIWRIDGTRLFGISDCEVSPNFSAELASQPGREAPFRLCQAASRCPPPGLRYG